MTEPDWHLWRAFLAVLRSGSLSAAARQLGLTQPTLGRQVAALEAALGAPLFTRSTEGLRPTEKALSLASHAEGMAAAAAALQRVASAEPDEPGGTVRLAASEMVGGVLLPPILTAFRQAQPAIDIELSLSNRNEDLLRREADLAVRNAAPTQSALVTRRIGDMPLKLYAHRDYVTRHGLPVTPQDLVAHTLIGCDEHLRVATLPRGLPLRFAFRCASDLGLHAALRAGYGIGYCQAGIAGATPDLVPVLPEIVFASIGFWVVMHEDLRATRRIRLLYDHLAEALHRHLAA